MRKFGVLIFSLFLAAFVLPVFAQGTAETQKRVDLVCMQKAVERRDTAIIAAFDVFSFAIKSALQTRLEELKTAWSIENPTERKKAIKSAWEKYRTVVKSARQTFQGTRKTAWKQFNVDRKACGAAKSDDASSPTADAL
ncbi:MAG: hypothetical protein AAB935_01205 [Patescibacteria group bacterium]